MGVWEVIRTGQIHDSRSPLIIPIQDGSEGFLSVCASINLTKREEIRVHLRRSIDTIHRFPDIEKIDKIETYAHRLHSRILVCVEEVEGRIFRTIT